MIRVLIADDHALVREGLRAVIDVQPDMTVIGEAENGVEAVAQARILQPDVILLDVAMPDMDGLQALAKIKANDPQARVLILTSFSQDEQVARAINGGALSYILKDGSPQELLGAIRKVARGESSLHPSLAVKVIRSLSRPTNSVALRDTITEREVEVMQLIAQGFSNQEIAAVLDLSKRTIGAHVSHILNKLHLTNRTQIALYALREGFAMLHPDT